MNICKTCGVEFIKKSNGQTHCEEHKPRGLYHHKPLIERNCTVCGVHFVTHKPNKVVCRKEYCRVKQKRINAAASYIKRKKERASGENSTCPKCGKKFNGDAPWEYCHLHSWMREKSDYGCEYSLGTR